MTATNESAPAGSALVECRGPFDFTLSLRAMRSFGMTAAQLKAARAEAAPEEAAREEQAAGRAGDGSLRLGVVLEDRPTLLEIRDARRSPAAVRGRSPAGA